jgi:hypothetical protein
MFKFVCIANWGELGFDLESDGLVWCCFSMQWLVNSVFFKLDLSILVVAFSHAIDSLVVDHGEGGAMVCISAKAKLLQAMRKWVLCVTVV